MDNDKKGFFLRTGEILGFINPAPLEGRQESDGSPSPGVIPPGPGGNTFITVDQALSIPAVYRSVSTIVSAISQMDLGVYRAGVEIDAPTVIKNPDIDSTRRSFVKKTVWSLAVHGNAYWRVYGNPVANLEVLAPETVSVIIENGKPKYHVGGKQVPANSIKHLRLESRPGVLEGFGPIQHGQGVLLGALRLKTFSDSWFTSGVPQGILTTDQSLNAEQASAFATAWKEFVKTNGTAVLSQGMHYEYLNLKPADAQYLEVQQATTVAIARLFGVPPSLLASGSEGSSNTYMNQQEMFIQFLQTTLVDYMNEIEDALSSILPRGQEVNFKEQSLLRMNSQMATAVAVSLYESNLGTKNEARAVAGMPPVDGGDAFASVPNTSNGDEMNGTD